MNSHTISYIKNQRHFQSHNLRSQCRFCLKTRYIWNLFLFFPRYITPTSLLTCFFSNIDIANFFNWKRLTNFFTTAGGGHTTSACYKIEKAGLSKRAERVDIKKSTMVQASNLFEKHFAYQIWASQLTQLLSCLCKCNRSEATEKRDRCFLLK